MKLAYYKGEYSAFTGLASSTSRQLALAGIALIWVFKTQGQAGYKLPNDLLLPAVCLILSLGSDLLQYVLGSIIWGSFHRYHEKKRSTITDDPEIEAPFYFTWPINLFFYSKIGCVLIAYFFLFQHAITSISFE